MPDPLFALERTSANGQTILDAAGIGIVAVGHRSTLVTVNPVAREFLDKGEIICTSLTGKVSLRDAKADMTMRQMLEPALAAPRKFSFLEHTSKGCARVTVVGLCKNAMADFFVRPTVAVLINVMHMDVGEVAASLASRFGLTSAEARLAEALDRGASLKEAAAAFGVSEGTARQQLKSVFRKMGVARQSELIRSMHDPTFMPHW